MIQISDIPATKTYPSVESHKVIDSTNARVLFIGSHLQCREFKKANFNEYSRVIARRGE